MAGLSRYYNNCKLDKNLLWSLFVMLFQKTSHQLAKTILDCWWESPAIFCRWRGEHYSNEQVEPYCFTLKSTLIWHALRLVNTVELIRLGLLLHLIY